LNITSTAFGLIIATLLPGLAGLYGLSFWSSALRRTFTTFQTSESNVGLFLLIVLAALALGLVASAIRWVVFERSFELGRFKINRDRLEPDQFQTLTKQDHLPAFKAVVDEHYRYHQFFGGAFVVWPILYVGWLKQYGIHRGFWPILITALGAVSLWILFYVAATDSRTMYVARARGLLGGE